MLSHFKWSGRIGFVYVFDNTGLERKEMSRILLRFCVLSFSLFLTKSPIFWESALRLVTRQIQHFTKYNIIGAMSNGKNVRVNSVMFMFLKIYKNLCEIRSTINLNVYASFELSIFLKIVTFSQNMWTIHVFVILFKNVLRTRKIRNYISLNVNFHTLPMYFRNHRGYSNQTFSKSLTNTSITVRIS